MSRDDEMDYRQIFPVEGRNRKRYTEKPRKPKEPKKTYGFFTPSPTEERKKKARPTRRNLGKRYEDDGPPQLSMEKMIRMQVAKDLNRSAKSIAAELDRLGYEAAPMTVSMIRQEMIGVLRLCQRHGSIIVPTWDD
ncbi:hypothetical protein IQ16_08200 [Bradyrhizobium huanghuaihaiense]|uniref:Uncharacterized protein n=1 Tax=Bradyrhizobium huanghuaihaiense TaxID=990078 RepID=A0A562QNH7_9BRAD|nr:hypothetical protein [Bradyrhizobium huanghuaihaiense]TWI58294.1 hypothetical protein IQ16_08200 [Bradyrhizobium huanghuaihaiense]